MYSVSGVYTQLPQPHFNGSPYFPPYFSNQGQSFPGLKRVQSYSARSVEKTILKVVSAAVAHATLANAMPAPRSPL